MEVICKIRKDLVLEEISRLTGYTGKTSNEVDIDNVAVTADEEKLIAPFWTNSVNKLFGVVRRFRVSVNNDADGISYNFDMPSSFDVKAISSIEETMQSFVVNSICSKWFNISKKEEVSYYISESERDSANIQLLLNKKCKPTKK